MAMNELFSLIEENPKSNPGPGFPPVGPAGGDLSGTYPNPTVAKIQGTSISAVAPVNGQILELVGGVWTPSTAPPAVPSGPAGGDLGGTYPNPSVLKLHGTPIVATAPTMGQIIEFDGTNWVPSDVPGLPTLPISEVNGGFGEDVSGIGTGLLVRTAANTYVTRTISSGTGTTATNGSGVAGNPSINVTYGTASSTATQGNDVRLPPAPSVAGDMIYDTGTAYAVVTAGTTSQVLIGGVHPAFGNVPAAALTSVPAASLTGVVAEANGGFGEDISALGAGLVTKTGTNTYVTRTLSAGTGTTVTNGAGTAGNPSVNVTYGTTSNTAVQGNDVRLLTPTAAGKVVIDTGTIISETAAGTSGQVLTSNGAATPTWNTLGTIPALPISEVNGGFGEDVSAIGTGYVIRSAANTYITRSLASGTGTSVVNASGIAGATSYNVNYGAIANTAVQGNDIRMNPTPTLAGKVIYDNGSTYAETAVGSTGQVLTSQGSGTPTWTTVTTSDVSGLTLWLTPIVGEVGYISGDDTMAKANAAALATAGAVGVYQGTANTVRVSGKALVFLVAGLTVTAGDRVWLTSATSGQASNVIPAPGSGIYAVDLGRVLNASTYNNATGSVVTCILNPKTPVLV